MKSGRTLNPKSLVTFRFSLSNIYWRYRGQSINQHRPQLLINHKYHWRYREQSICQHRPQPSHNHIYHIQSLSMRIDPDKAYQVARSTKFRFQNHNLNKI